MDEGFDPNAYKLFAKAGYNPNEPPKLGKLSSEAAMRQPREGLGYKQLSLVRISIRRASINYITVEDESSASNKPSVFDRLGKSTMRTSMFERLGPLNKDEDVKDAPPEFQEGVKTTVDALKEVNLGTDEEPRPTYLIALLEVDEENTYIELLKEFRDVFAWSYKEMPGLDHKVAVHYLAVKSVKYPTWVSSIIPVRKTNGQIRVCVDFRDLNNACPKDEFSLPIPELMIDATTGYEAISFMDGSSGYNQIRMAPKDEELTAFRTPKDIYCYKVMPFGLKNAGATYQRAMQNIFDDLLHKNVECYVDDLVPPVLAAPIPEKSLILYISAQETSVGALLAQENSEGKENSLYYLSRMITPNELNYSPIKKLCLSLVFSIQKLKHYFQAHVVRLVSRANPIKFVMSKPVLNDRLARWYLQFQQFEIVYIPQKAIKGQALADFLADHPILDDWELTDELPDEDAMVIEVQPLWKLYFDGAAHHGEAGVGVVFGTSQGVALKEVKKEYVASFILVNIIYHFGIPRYIITDNGKPFDNRLMNNICDLFGFKQHNSLMYNTAANGLAEAFKKTLCNLLKKVISKSKRDWNDRTEEALWAYSTTHCTPTQSTPYSLVYGVEAVLPLERQIPSLRLAIQEEITDEENARL
ncbi:uncharacterized protein [Nicotiana tomentosiformis]|uniref:uncharacterized protein n=1 Tax=Nicotiana tomentosiformis TaxID=4098 RepID=UPI00388CA9CF